MSSHKDVEHIRKREHVIIDESSESSEDSITDDKELDLVSQSDKYNYEIDPEGTTPELDSPCSSDLFETNEEIGINQVNNKISVGVNTDPFMNDERTNDLDTDTIEKCYTLGLIIGRAMTKMSRERREDFIHQLSHCFELYEMKK